MSDSETSAETCILVRSCAIVKSVGAWNEAATVWPTSYCRSTTTPSIGATIRLLRRSVSACASDAWACCDGGRRRVVVGLRLIEVGLRREPLVPQRLLAAQRDLGVAHVDLGLVERRAGSAPTRSWNGVGSSSARRSPFFTCLLKSAWSAATFPETTDSDLDRRHGREGARGGHRLRDVAALDLRRPVLRLRLLASAEHEERPGHDSHCGGDPDERLPAHHAPFNRRRRGVVPLRPVTREASRLPRPAGSCAWQRLVGEQETTLKGEGALAGPFHAVAFEGFRDCGR